MNFHDMQEARKARESKGEMPAIRCTETTVETTKGAVRLTQTVVDMTPTWGNTGATIAHLIRTRHWAALDTLAPDMARAFASAEALRVIARELPDPLAQRVAEVLAAELTKQGY